MFVEDSILVQYLFPYLHNFTEKMIKNEVFFNVFNHGYLVLNLVG